MLAVVSVAILGFSVVDVSAASASPSAAAVNAATAATAPFTTAPVPTLPGTAKVGSIITATRGPWSPAPTFSYVWKRAGVVIPGATALSYVPVAADLGKTLTITVTGTKTGYTTTSKTSAASSSVAAGSIAGATPTVSGTARVGSTLSSVRGTWSPTGVAFGYQWKRAGTSIAGATSSTYVPVSADVGKTITLVVTGTKAGYATVTKTSAATSAVVAATLAFVAVGTPTITGTAKVGSRLAATSGTWTPSPTFSYQWKRAGVAIPGATATAYSLVSADAGKAITVTVTGTKSGYSTASKTSAPTAAVVPGNLSSSVPTVSGSASVGSTLTAVEGSWGPAPVTFTYVWRRDGAPIAGGTVRTYVVTTADVGARLSVDVTGSRAGYASRTMTSASTATVPSTTGRVTGTVVNTSGQALSSATVQLMRLSAAGEYSVAYQMVTGVDGAFSFGAVAPGNYNLYASRAGYQSGFAYSTPGSIEADASYVWKSVLTPVPVVTTGKVTGTVVNTAGQLLSSATVQLVRLNAAGNYAVVSQAVTGTNGAFAFTTVTPGSYNLYVSRSGYLPEYTYASPFAVEAGASYVAKPVLVPVPTVTTGRITGTIVNTAGQALSSATVQLTRLTAAGEYTIASEVVTGSDGTFVFAAVSPGSYNLYVARTGYYTRYAYTSPGTIEAGGTYAWSATLTPIPVVTTGTVRGTVSTQSGQAIQGVTVTLQQLLNDGSYRNVVAASTDGSGRFAFTSVASGQYNLYFDGTPNFTAGFYSSSAFDVLAGDDLTANKVLPAAVAGNGTASTCFVPKSPLAPLPQGGTVTAQFSGDGVNWTAANSYTIGANNCFSIGVSSGVYWRLSYYAFATNPQKYEYTGVTEAHFFGAGQSYAFPNVTVNLRVIP